MTGIDGLLVLDRDPKATEPWYSDGQRDGVRVRLPLNLYVGKNVSEPDALTVTIHPFQRDPS